MFELEVDGFFPDLGLLDQQSRPTTLSIESQGRPIVVVFYAENRDPLCAEVLRGFAAIQESVSELADLYVVTNELPAGNNQAAIACAAALPLLSDPRQKAAQACGVGHNTQTAPYGSSASCVTSFVTDANRRILQINRNVTDADHPARILDFLRSQPRVEAREIGFVAPVIYVPKVFDERFCRQLIEVYETRGNEPGTLLHDGPDGVAEIYEDPKIKIRRDHYVNDPALMEHFRRRIGQLIPPEIYKATHYPVTRFEEFKICCYDGSTGGHFTAHRDNQSQATAHRRFAMTLNLNSGDYEGGHLRFPEYGPHLYRPDTGDAVVFSCSLAHEAMPVTRGKRYVLLAFLYGEEDRPALRERDAAYRVKRDSGSPVA